MAHTLAPTALAAVCDRLARAWFRAERVNAPVGRFTLRPAQRAAVAAIHDAFTLHGGALLADPPGTGKTIVALAIAREFESALVLAPAAVRTQWERAAARAGASIRFVSLEALSRDADPARAPLLIVDEAHHLRTPGTRRYRRAALLAAGARVLLLTATPVVNRRADRDALLALFLGGRSATLDSPTLARLIIRRTGERAALPSVRRLSALDVGCAPSGIGVAIAELPPPFPAADGAAALALIRITLAMAWCSSLAALDASLRRRLQRGEALADALAAGRWPTRHALRRWVIANDATQLAFPALVTPEERVPPATALPVLRAHLDAVRRLRALVTSAVASDTATRASALRHLCDTQPAARVVLFAHHADTVRALWHALRVAPGTIAITGERVFAAAGRWTRAEVLASLGPRATPWRRDDPRGIRLVLATDLLSEGVELQGAQILVHGDGAWTPARLEQRIGRLARVGAVSGEVLVTEFQTPRDARPLLRLEARLARKEQARQSAIAVASVIEMIGARLTPWLTHSTSGDRVAAMSASVSGFIAAVRIGPTVQLVTGRSVRGRYRVNETPRALLSMLEHRHGVECPASQADVRAARHALALWSRRLSGARQVGDMGGSDSSQKLWRRTRQQVDLALAGASLAARPSFAARLHQAIRVLLEIQGAGMMQRLRTLLRETRDPGKFGYELIALAAEYQDASISLRPTGDTRKRLVALLLLSAAHSAPPTTSPRTAAPR